MAKKKKDQKKTTFGRLFSRRMLWLFPAAALTYAAVSIPNVIIPSNGMFPGVLERLGKAGMLDGNAFQALTNGSVIDGGDQFNTTLSFMAVQHFAPVRDADGRLHIEVEETIYESEGIPMVRVQEFVPDEELSPADRAAKRDGKLIPGVHYTDRFYPLHLYGAENDLYEADHAPDSPFDLAQYYDGLYHQAYIRLDDVYISEAKGEAYAGRFDLVKETSLPYHVEENTDRTVEHYDFSEVAAAAAEDVRQLISGENVKLHVFNYGTGRDNRQLYLDTVLLNLNDASGHISHDYLNYDKLNELQAPDGCELRRDYYFVPYTDPDLPAYYIDEDGQECRLPDNEYKIILASITRTDKTAKFKYILHFLKENYTFLWPQFFVTLIGWTAAALAWAALSLLRYTRREHRLQKEAYRTNLTNTLAHDLRSPLTAISGYAENLIDNVHTEKREYYSQMILQNAQYMDQMIADVLQLSKIEQEQENPPLEALDLTKLCWQLLQERKDALDARGITLLREEGTLLTRGNPAITQQLLQNLADNAVKYTADGGRITLAVSGRSLRLSNTSAEAAPADPAALLQPFVKGDISRSARRGSGLGLALVQSLAERQHMKITLEAKDGIFTAVLTCPKEKPIKHI